MWHLFALASWQTDEIFKPFVESIWSGNLNYINATTDFVNKVGNWNKDTFGHIFERKKELFSKIGGIQRTLDKRYNSMKWELSWHFYT